MDNMYDHPAKLEQDEKVTEKESSMSTPNENDFASDAAVADDDEKEEQHKQEKGKADDDNDSHNDQNDVNGQSTSKDHLANKEQEEEKEEEKKEEEKEEQQQEEEKEDNDDDSHNDEKDVNEPSTSEGCSVGRFGDDCSFTCYCAKRGCDPDTGQCDVAGCQTGWKGPSC